MSNECESTPEHYDIVVVGAGLVGASFAALLLNDPVFNVGKGQQGNSKEHHTPYRIALIDGGTAPSLPSFNTENPSFDPRVVALTHASQAIFKSLGLWQNITSQRACAYQHMHVWDDDGTAHIQFNAADIQESHLGYIVENSILQCAVLDAIERHEKVAVDTDIDEAKAALSSTPIPSSETKQSPSITLLRGVSVTALELSPVNNTVKHQTSSATSPSRLPSTLHCSNGQTLVADLIVAADGGQSKIRELANIATREWSYQHKAIVATVQSSQSHQFTAWQNFLSSGPLAFLPLDHPSEQYCSIVWSLETEKADAMMALNDDDFAKALERAFETRLGTVISVSKRFCFPLHQRHATHYSHNNIVLIGDAAHTIHPLAGQGVNLGLLDAQALAAEIVRAIQRDLPLSEASILRRYQRQRKAHNIEVMLLMESFKRLFGSKHLWVRLLRNAGMKKVNAFPLLKNWLAKQAIKNKD